MYKFTIKSILHWCDEPISRIIVEIIDFKNVVRRVSFINAALPFEVFKVTQNFISGGKNY